MAGDKTSLQFARLSFARGVMVLIAKLLAVFR